MRHPVEVCSALWRLAAPCGTLAAPYGGLRNLAQPHKRGLIGLYNTTTPAGLRRPDIVAWNSGTRCYIVDVTVAADNAELANVHKLKVDYYNNEHIRNWAFGVSGKSEVMVSSISFNWRGAVALES